ncbi:MAG: [protein-PII] uridylyltransferase [Pseudomonadota bacterium]
MDTTQEIDSTPVVTTWRERLIEGRAALKAGFFVAPNPRQLLHSHSRFVDGILAGIWAECDLPETLSLVAVGGYGRGELYPFSDVDVLVLLPESMETSINDNVEQFVRLLWDCGLEIGHSVRTISQCMEEAAQDITVMTNLLEARHITGDNQLFAALKQAIKQHLDVPAFFQTKVAELQSRHARFQDTASNLEPNIKENPGGLRDLQVILWIAHATGVGGSWRDLATHKLITGLEARQTERRERVLQNLRIRLHYLANRREDRLLFDYQTALSRELHLTSHGNRRPSERLMQAFYRTAKSIGQINTIVLQNFSAQILFKLDAAPIPINHDFEIRNNLLEARHENLYQRHPTAILETFLLLQQHTELEGIGASTLRSLWRAKAKINSGFRRDRTNRDLFMAILRHPTRVTFVLRRMNQYGILGRYIPAFGRIVGQMQHDLFHVYTVDAHILTVVRNLRRFLVPAYTHEYPFCSALIQNFERPETLVIAALFHDIAKGRGGDHSQLGSHDARRFCRSHHISDEDSDLICWLVEQHLYMSSVAQKQDLSDPDVINAFARKVANERQLIALYLLTVADIRGTSPKVWNAWKSKLLEDLFRSTQRVLREGKTSAAVDIAVKQREALRILRHYALADSVHEPLWSKLDDHYFQRFDAADIAWQTRMLVGKVQSREAVVRARLSPVGEGVQVFIYAPDQEALFARICGFFERTDYEIVDAKIYTTRHGYALDSFQILDASGKAIHYRDVLNYIEYELGERITKQAPLEPSVKTRLSRRLKHFPIEPKLDIEEDEKGRYFRLSFVAGDRPGLLSTIARVLVEHHVSLHSAKITTLGERAEDTLQVSGDVFGNPTALQALREDLLVNLRT